MSAHGIFSIFGICLIAVKLLKTCSFFIAYDVLRIIHIVQFLFIVKLCCSLIFTLLHKPFEQRRYSKSEWASIVRFSFCDLLLNFLFIFGLTLCGPLRFILIFEQSHTTVLNTLQSFFGSASKSKIRGSVMVLIGIITLLLFDVDNVLIPAHPEGQHHSWIVHAFYSVLTLSGLADHKSGVILLVVTLLASTMLHNYRKKLAVEMRGAKTLQTLSSIASTVILLPLMLLSSFYQFYLDTNTPSSMSWTSTTALCVLCAVFGYVVSFYGESLSSAKLEAHRGPAFSAIVSFASAVFIAYIWQTPFSIDVPVQHVMSGGVVIAATLFTLGTWILSAPANGPSRGAFIGYGADGNPLYSYANQRFIRTTQSIQSIVATGFKQILAEKDSRQIFYYLCLNLSFTFVELFYGVFTNSLGLISDGFHMLFDCSALIMGLAAAVMSRWKRNRMYPYGYGRVEVLSGFVNGLFLLVIAFFVFTEAVDRLFDPPDIKEAGRLVVVSVLGLIVNLFGIVSFHEAHHHGGGGCSHDHGGHSHNHGSHDHSHSHGHDHDHHHGSEGEPKIHQNTNMKGVFLHILADTLGSVGVIFSSFLINQFGWVIADPICSIIIAILIAMSVYPLLQDTSRILLNATPSEMKPALKEAFSKILEVEDVISCKESHVWRHSSNLVCCTMQLHVTPIAQEQKIVNIVTGILKDLGIQDIVIQVEKEEFYHHMSGLTNMSKYHHFQSSLNSSTFSNI